MRTKLLVLAAAAALTFAGTANASTIELVWQGTGTNTTAAASSSVITADIVLVINNNIHTLTWSIEWDLDAGDELDYVTASSGVGPATNFTLLGQGNTAGNPGQESSWAYSTGNGTPVAFGTFTVGTITFHATGNVTTDGIDVTPTFNNSPAGDGCNGGSCNGTVTLQGASVIPEPGTVALLSLGLAGLGLMGRRSRR